MTRCADYTPLQIEMSDVRCPDPAASEAMKDAIDRAIDEGVSLGGTFRVIASGLVEGLGDYASGPERLTSQLGAALFAVPAIKGVEFGIGFQAAELPGSQVHDPIVLSGRKFVRATNNAGGLEGGMTNGMPLVMTCAMKPIPTMARPLATVNLDTFEVAEASRERSDVCAVPAAAVVAESEVAFVLANAYLRQFGDANMTDILASIEQYKQRLRNRTK